MNFNELNINDKIVHAVSEMGFEKPTPIQQKTIPLLIDGMDVIGHSQTGTGKTAAFAIPILDKIDINVRRPQALIICPTRELSVQVCNEFRKIGKYMRSIKSVPIYGGEPIRFQIMALKKGAQIIVGTPGRLMDHLKRKTIKLDNVHTVVLDEADEMLKMGFREDIESILNYIKHDKQLVLFSATMPKSILEIADKYQNKPTLVKIKNKGLATDTIKQNCYFVKQKYKIETLCRLLNVYNPKLALVFCNTKRNVDEVCDTLQNRGFECDKLHGDMNQKVRLNVLNKFNKGVISILVATDVAARGLDINDVEAVFNFEVPDDEEYYVHRIGRTGRAGKKGRSFTLVSPQEQYKLRKIMQYIKQDIKKRSIPSSEKVNEVKIKKCIDVVKEKMQNEDLKQYLNIVNKLANEGYSLETIAAVLLKLNIELEETDKSDFSYSIDDTRGNRDNKRSNNKTNKRNKRAPEKGMSRLYFNIGKQHNAKVSDILGAITGECDIKGNQVGTIDMFDKFTFVEVPKNYSKSVLENMNKKRIKGRKVKVEIANG